MGSSHARAYHSMPEFEVVGLVSRGAASRGRVNAELGGQYVEFSEYRDALKQTRETMRMRGLKPPRLPEELAELEK